jgi:hypothetical protein
MVLRQDLQITSVKEEIHRFRAQYRARLYTHPNNLTVHLTVPPGHRRLRRHLPIDLPTSSKSSLDIVVLVMYCSLYLVLYVLCSLRI